MKLVRSVGVDEFDGAYQGQLLGQSGAWYAQCSEPLLREQV